MMLDPETRALVIERAAQILANDAKEAAGGIDNLIVLRPATVASLYGISKSEIGRKMPIREFGPKVSGVTLGDYKEFLENAKAKKGMPK